VQQKEVRSTGFRVSSPEFFLFNIHKSVYFCKVTTLESGLISYFFTLKNIIIWRPHDHPTPVSGVATPSPSGLTPMAFDASKAFDNMENNSLSGFHLTVVALHTVSHSISHYQRKYVIGKCVPE